MSGETIYEQPRRYNVAPMRVHDYLYDSAYIVSGARDYARTAFKAAMASAQVVIQPVYKTMFSELRKFPRMQVVYHPNCRLPHHVDRSYGAYVQRVRESRHVPAPELAGKDRFKFCATPKKLLPVPSATPDFHPPTPNYGPAPTKPRNRGTQSLYRESSAQTTPWQPDGKQADTCEQKPEVLYLDNLQWGPGCPYRTGDLPVDFHTTEIINKMRHARKWTELVEKGQFPRWMKKQDAIITDIETKDWIFREAEIDELQDIRLSLLHKLQSEKRQKQTTRVGKKLAKLWACKKMDMERKIEHIRRTRDRELSKLTALHAVGGRTGLVEAQRAARGGGSVTTAAADRTADTHAPRARHGYQASRRHADIVYDPSLLALEDHKIISEPPPWLDQCGQNLTKSCSGHHLPRDVTQLCERETKWSEQFLENLHNDLKKARLGAQGHSAGPLKVLKPRRLVQTPRPPTPEVEAVPDDEEQAHQAALTLQRIVRGRAVQNLMYEGRTRAAELTEELKTTHGLQKEDRARIAREETKARDHNALRTEAEQKEDAITALVEELCGGAVSAALDFLEKELRRLKEERRHHAFILIALREKTMREAAEAGRRQKEEQRRREHDEMFKQILGVTQDTVDIYLQEILQQGVELAAEEDAVSKAMADADRIEDSLKEHGSMSTAEQNELVAELVQQFLLPEVHRTSSRLHLAAVQQSRMEAARCSVFGMLHEREMTSDTCTRCGEPIGDTCRCEVCTDEHTPTATSARDDKRWKYTRSRPSVTKSRDERFPPSHDIRCWLNDLLNDVVIKSRRQTLERTSVERDVADMLRKRADITVEVRETIDEMIAIATGEYSRPIKMADYRHLMTRFVGDALQRSEPFQTKCTCPKELPSEIRQRAEEEAAKADPSCKCGEVKQLKFDTERSDEKSKLLPSELRLLEEMRRCKCDTEPSPSARTIGIHLY
ncbi:cilia- and flagella-associated protein 91-like [Colias croceus]|uniref:cilia- and flagella-associated protein 91-like n=1 Tax=Colias crocea TaxID=72248 RepID=UPI001E280B67|nr:cilia- and flagella-associated protein 91-like [Colias croceus]